MKDLKDILEGVLNNIEDTLVNSDNNVETVKMSVLHKKIIDGISSQDPKKQKTGVETFKRILLDNKAKQSMNYSKAALSNGWWVQFKKTDVAGVPEFVMIRTIGTNYYIICIYNYGREIIYRSITPQNFHYIEYYLEPKDNYFFKVPNNNDDLQDICNDIRKTTIKNAFK